MVRSLMVATMVAVFALSVSACKKSEEPAATEEAAPAAPAAPADPAPEAPAPEPDKPET